MPELPDITVYNEALERHLKGHLLEDVRLKSPFLLRSAVPPLSAVKHKRILGFRRLGKRIVFVLEDELFLVLHLMVAGRLQLKKAGAALSGRNDLAAFDTSDNTVVLTEAGTKKRASLYVVEGEAALSAHDPGGLELSELDLEGFKRALGAERHTLKRALTDPRILSGIGNAYSDEILHRAKLSPARRTDQLDDAGYARLFAATQDVLREWTERLRAEAAEGFPTKVTAFRPEMAVHGKRGEPCPLCGEPVQAIKYASNETNYCARCQTEGRLLADRGMSRLLKDDWPKTLEALEALKRTHRNG